MRYLFCALILLVVSGFLCCKKSTKKEAVVTPVNLNVDFKDYFNYQPGSYWVFDDSLNRMRDSFYVLSYLDSPSVGNTTASEQVKIVIRDSSFTWTGAPAWYEDWTLSLTSAYYSVLSIDSAGTNFFFDTLTSDMPFSPDSYYNSHSYRRCLLLPTYSVNNATYSNVTNIISYTYGGCSILININHDNGFLHMVFQTDSTARSVYLLHSHIVR